MTKERDNYFDLLKGIAILGVVSIHLLGSSSLFQGENYHGWSIGLIRQFVCCSVPVFMFLAGYFSGGGGIYNRAKRLLIPYLFWTFIEVAIFRPVDFCNPFQFVMRDVLFGYGVGIGYFVIVLLQLALLSPQLKKSMRVRPRSTLAGVVALNLVGIGIYYALAIRGVPVFGLCIPAPIPAIFFPVWILPYALGIWCRQTQGLLVYPIRKVISIGTVSFVAMIIEAFYWRDGFIEISQLRLSSFVFSLCACLVMACTHIDVGRKNVLVVLGRGSYFIYFTHMKSFILFYELKKFGCWFDGMSIIVYLVDMAAIVLMYFAIIYWTEGKVPLAIRKIIGVS